MMAIYKDMFENIDLFEPYEPYVGPLKQASLRLNPMISFCNNILAHLGCQP